jgi:hypothetical protein
MPSLLRAFCLLKGCFSSFLQLPVPFHLFRRRSLLPQDNSELRFAGVGRVIESFALALTFCSSEEEALFGMLRQANETRLAVRVGTDLKVELMKASESVGDVDADVGRVDGLTGFIVDGEIGGTGSKTGVDGGDGLGGVVSADKNRAKK